MAKNVLVGSKAIARQKAGIPETSKENLHLQRSGRWLEVPVREGRSVFTLRWLSSDERINREEWSRLTDEARATWPLHQHPGPPAR